MPVPKRYFHCSQEINSDPEMWAFTSEFGDRAVRTWLQILVYLDRSTNSWRTSGDWLATLSRTVRQSSANLSRQIRWLVENKWLTVGETAADGSPLVFKSPNWGKYNRSQEQKGNGTNPDQGAGKDPLLSFPTPSPTPHTTPKKRALPRPRITLDEFQITPELEEWASKEKIPNPSAYLDEFKDYWLGEGKAKKDWAATFRNRLRYLRDSGRLKVQSGGPARQVIPPKPPANDPIGRGLWEQSFGSLVKSMR